MGKFIRYIFKRKTVYAPSGDIRGAYDPLTLDRDVELVILAGKAKDPTGVAQLMAKYNVTTASELIPLLPRRKRPSVARRLRQWAQRLLGLTEYDPMAHIGEQAQRRRGSGMTITHLGR